MKRIANVALTFVATLAMVTSAFPASAIAEALTTDEGTAYATALASDLGETGSSTSGASGSGAGSSSESGASGSGASGNGAGGTAGTGAGSGADGDGSGSGASGDNGSGSGSNGSGASEDNGSGSSPNDASSANASEGSASGEADDQDHGTADKNGQASDTANEIGSADPTDPLAETANAQALANGADTELLTVECDAADDFTVDTYTDPVNLLTADGEAVSSAAASVVTKVLAAYDECASEVTFEKADNITVADVHAGMDLVYASAEYYWASTSYSLSYYDADHDQTADDTEIAGGLALNYVVDTTNIATVRAETEAKIAEALSWVDADNMTDFEAAQALHDYLVRNCAYDTAATSSTTPTQSHTAYGALVEKSAVCQGYALAYKLLLGRAGIPCVFVTSTYMNHAWNMVQIDGNWYHVDVTWDDPLINGSDGGFDVDMSHNYFLRSDSTMSLLGYSNWEAAYTTPASDYSNRTYATYNAPATTSTGTGSGSTSGSTDTSTGSGTGNSGSVSETSHAYAHKDTATSGSLVLTVEWDDPVMGQETTFHVSATGGSGSYKYYMAAPAYSNPNEWSFDSVPDPSRGEYTKYSGVCVTKDFSFAMTATGTYFYKFYVMDMGKQPYTTLNTRTFVSVSDTKYPSVASIVSDAVSQAQANTDGSEYEMALWLHDWLLDQLDYDESLKWASAEAALTRHTGTCQAYTNAYIKLLTAAGITNAETRDTHDGHTWNAVKLDGEWYQVDCTWDDNDDTKYYGFDARHLYFAITDELMAIAHKGHTNIYTASDYATRSTSLKDNYYVKSGLASQWADSYAARIQAQLDAKETGFSITSDNALNPPSIIGIQNAIVAYAINQKVWKNSDGQNVNQRPRPTSP